MPLVNSKKWKKRNEIVLAKVDDLEGEKKTNFETTPRTVRASSVPITDLGGGRAEIAGKKSWQTKNYALEAASFRFFFLQPADDKGKLLLLLLEKIIKIITLRWSAPGTAGRTHCRESESMVSPAEEPLVLTDHLLMG